MSLRNGLLIHCATLALFLAVISCVIVLS